MAWLPWLQFPAVWAVVLLIAAHLLPARLDRVRFNMDIGHADGVAYAWQGRRMAEGRGWHVPYVSNFYHRYTPGVDRFDDQWPPLLGFVLAPVFRHFGPEANVARMTTVWISTVFLPLSLCLLVQAVSRQAWPGLLAPLPVWRSTELLVDSLTLNTDQLLAGILCLFLAALFAGRKWPALLWTCGPLMALAWYGKGSQVVLIPFFLGAVALLNGLRGLWRWPVWAAVLSALLLASPRLLENQRYFGRPLHSTQSPVSAFFGLSPRTWDLWEQGFYSVHWNGGLPGLRNRFEHPALHARSIRRNSEATARPLLLGLDATAADWAAWGDETAALAELLQESRALPALRPALETVFRGARIPRARLLQVAGMLMALLAVPVAVLAWCFRTLRGKAPPDNAPFAVAATLGLFVLMQALFVILFWEALSRLTYVATLPALALPWVWLPAAPQRLRPITRWTAPLLTLGLCLLFLHQLPQRLPEEVAEQMAHFQRPAPTSPQFPEVHRLGQLMMERLPPDAVLMTRRPWQTLWYLPETFRAVGIPFARPPELLAVARFYGVTHLILDQNRPGLREFIRDHPAYFELVIRRPRNVFLIRWEAIPEELIPDIDTLEPLWDARVHLRQAEERLAATRPLFQEGEEEEDSASR